MKCETKVHISLAVKNFSPHTHSVWETICDAGTSLGEKILCSKSTQYPILGKSRIPRPQELKIVRNFGSELTKNTKNTYVQGTDVWRLIAISPTDNLSLFLSKN